MPKTVLIVGCGYLGLPLARHFLSAGCRVIGLTASAESAKRLRSEPFPVYPIDVSIAGSLCKLPQRRFDVVIQCASSGRGGVESYRSVFLNGSRNLFSALDFDHLLISSSTSVYAQTDGSAVNEDSPATPERETGRILLSAENLGLGQGGTVARLAGLYGPGRCVPLEKLLRGAALLEGEGERVLNSIHQTDAVSALALLADAKPGGIFNVTDNHPVTQREWFEWVCGMLRMKLPPAGSRDLNRKRGWTNKRVSNKKLRALGWEPRYPSFREGLTDVLTEILKSRA